MYDQRLRMLQQGGMAVSILKNVHSALPETALDAIGNAETPQEAKVIYKEALAESKATIDTGSEEE